ncbi:LysR family transcriptional regulator [Motiliproteus sp. SC1-56]|uniref:LysR family transcriptional regulator n=1 Tax=Motiliproteus sp. SC1-56 TaxID=2799565 RepID=UPI001A8DAD2D|nr:LysR family transcriptional regulator [Motiliproteus sp. SC1-56]
MDFRSLRYFVAVYEELSLSAASKRCFVAQPSISAAIQQLESELECPLFVRHSKGVTPTPEGTLLYPDACRVLSDIQSIKAQFQERPEHLPLTLGLMPFLSRKRVSLIIKALIQEVPGLDLTLVDTAQQADARIISSTILEPNEAFHKLWVDRYVFAMPEGHPLAQQEFVALEQLNNLPFISRKPCDITDAWQYALQKKGINLNVKATVRTEEYALDLVAAGLGVSVVPRHSTDGRDDLVIREFNGPPLERVVGLAHTQDSDLPPGLLSAIDGIKPELS